jgi:hypothetical protein
MNVRFLATLACMLIFFSCLDTSKSKPEQGESDAQKPPAGTVPASTQVTGLGIAKGKNRQMTEIAAKQNANASVAEQIQGAYFEYRSDSGKILFSTDTGEVTLAGVQVISLESQETGNGWLTYAVASGQLEVKLPKDFSEVGVTVTAKEKDPAALLFSLKKEALRRAAEIRSNGLAKIYANGRIYLKSVTLDVSEDGSTLDAEAEFGVYFFQFRSNDTDR